MESVLKDEAEVKRMQEAAEKQQAENAQKVMEQMEKDKIQKETTEGETKDEKAAESSTSDDGEEKEYLTAKERKNLDKMFNDYEETIAKHESKIEEQDKSIKDLK